MTFRELEEKWRWKPIRRCPGRYVLADVPSGLPLEELIDVGTRSFEFTVDTARDKVIVVPLDQGGLITYKRADGSCLHTLNDSDGLSRKLKDLGISLVPHSSAIVTGPFSQVVASTGTGGRTRRSSIVDLTAGEYAAFHMIPKHRRVTPTKPDAPF